MPGPGEATPSLPCCFALKSKHHETYLRYVHEEDETSYGQLRLDGEDVLFNPFTMFDSEPSLRHQGLVHIRCRYNRKYWVPRQRGGGWWIVADAHEPEEDLDSPNCTLIKPIIVTTTVVVDGDVAEGAEAAGVMTVRFVHAGHGKETRMTFSKGDGGRTAACMRVAVAGDDDDDHHAETGKGGAAAEEEHDDDDFVSVLRFDPMSKRLPTFLVFKGHNDLYLRAVTANGQDYLQFSAVDPGAPAAIHEVTYYKPPGSTWNMDRDEVVILVRNIHLNKYWSHAHGGQWVTPTYTLGQGQIPEDRAWFSAVDVIEYYGITSIVRYPVFLPVTTTTTQQQQQEEPTTRLQVLAAERSFVKSAALSGSVANCLNANTNNRTITNDARIRVEEAVIDREIYNVEYRLREARIYDTNVLTMATATAVNDTSRENTKRLTLSYEESEMSTWDATVQLKLGYRSRLRAGFPKLGLGATVEISAEFFGEYKWGNTMEKKARHEVEYEVTVPPKTKVTVSLLATRSAVDVPFNYRQRDVMSTDGEARDVPMTDGIYTGINSYNFNFHTTEEKLKPRQLLIA